MCVCYIWIFRFNFIYCTVLFRFPNRSYLNFSDQITIFFAGMANGRASPGNSRISCERPRANAVDCLTRQSERATDAAVESSARAEHFPSARAKWPTGGEDGGAAEPAMDRPVFRPLILHSSAAYVRERRVRDARARLGAAQREQTRGRRRELWCGRRKRNGGGGRVGRAFDRQQRGRLWERELRTRERRGGHEFASAAASAGIALVVAAVGYSTGPNVFESSEFMTTESNDAIFSAEFFLHFSIFNAHFHLSLYLDKSFIHFMRYSSTCVIWILLRLPYLCFDNTCFIQTAFFFHSCNFIKSAIFYLFTCIVVVNR